MSPITSYACSSNANDVQSEKVVASNLKSSSSSSCPCAFRHAPWHAYRLVSGPQRPARCRVAVVQCEFRSVKRGLDPGEEVVAVGHSALHLLGNSIGFKLGTYATERVPMPGTVAGPVFGNVPRRGAPAALSDPIRDLANFLRRSRVDTRSPCAERETSGDGQ
jgi:hypothetical protein